MAIPPLLLGAVLASLLAAAAGWGQDGHHLTCMIAESRLSADAQQAIDKLLPRGDFVRLCSWADTVRRSYRFRWSGPLHYIDTPDQLCTYDYDRDCHNEHGEKDMCVSGAINNYTAQLRTSSSSKSSSDLLLASYNLTEALLFLSHYMGDIHQPLHVGFTSDAGGNSIRVHWYTRTYNLHHIWDSEFINKAISLYYDDLEGMATAISKNITTRQARNWGGCDDGEEAAKACIDNYATESIKAACKWAYAGAEANSKLGDEYFDSRLPIVEQRLAQGGVRLAALLNRIFASSSAQSRAS